MKILSVENIREADQYTIKNEPIDSFDLMKRAANAATRYILKNSGSEKFIIFCGPGNNGGDGLVIARILTDKGYKVRVAIVEFSSTFSDDFTKALAFLGEICIIEKINEDNFNAFQFDSGECIIDAMLGSGLNKPPTGWLADWIKRINKQASEVISIDFPSGLFADRTSAMHPGSIIKATKTVTFELPKLSMLAPENQQFCGEWKLVPIGLNSTFIEKAEAIAEMVTEDLVYKMLIPRNREGHKGTFGHALLIAGGEGKFGAAILAARALLRSGCGLSTLLTSKESMSIFHATVPELMLRFYKNDLFFVEESDTFPYTSCGIGPGLGVNEKTKFLLSCVLLRKVPVVIDADAISTLAENPELWKHLHDKVILTPHIGECDRLLGISGNYFDRMEKIRAFCRRYSVTVLLKGRFSVIFNGDGLVFFNPTGSQAMAKGGSGDVLTGLISGLLAQSYCSSHAAVLGAYLHGLAGQIAAQHWSDHGLKSGEIADYLADAWLLAENHKLNTDASFIEAI